MARATVSLNFNAFLENAKLKDVSDTSILHHAFILIFIAFLEKAKLKDDGSNYTDWVRNLRTILIAA